MKVCPLEGAECSEGAGDRQRLASVCEIRGVTGFAGLSEDAGSETTSLELAVPVANAALTLEHVQLPTSGSCDTQAQKIT